MWRQMWVPFATVPAGPDPRLHILVRRHREREVENPNMGLLMAKLYQGEELLNFFSLM